MLINAYLESLRAARRSPETIRIRRTYLRYFATDVPLILAFSVARWQLPAEAA